MDRYIIKELFAPFTGGLGIILFVLVLDFLLDILNLIIAKGVPVFTVGKLFVFNLAWMLTLAMPMAALISSLMAYGRLSSDSEITATKALGVPFLRLMIPGILAMSLLSIVMIIFGDIVLPEANYSVKKLMVQIHKKKPMAALHPRIFIDDFPGLVLYMEKVDDRAGKIYGVTIYEKQQGRAPRTITAPEGDVRYDPEADAIAFTLYNGTIHDIDPEDPAKYTLAEFNRQVINITDLGIKLGDAGTKQRGDRELSIRMIHNQIAEQQAVIDSCREQIRRIVAGALDSLVVMRDYRRRPSSSPIRRAMLFEKKRLSRIKKLESKISNSLRRRRKLETELQKKYSLPLACLLFLILGAPVGAWARKGGLGIAVGLSFGFFLMYWAFLIGGEELADRGIVSPFIGMWTGNFILLVIGLSMLYRVTYEARFSGVGWLTTLFQKIKDRREARKASHR